LLKVLQGQHMLYTLPEAAKAIGLDEGAILEALENGHIIGTRDLSSGWLIEDAEIHRLYLSIAQDYCKRKCQVEPLKNNRTTTEPEIPATAEGAEGTVQQDQNFRAGAEQETSFGTCATASILEQEIRIDDRDKILVSEARLTSERLHTAFIGCAVVLVIGCIGGLSSFNFLGESQSPEKKANSSAEVRGTQEEQTPLTPAQARSGKEASGDVPPAAMGIDPPQAPTQPLSKAVIPDPVMAKQNPAGKKSRKLVPVPETRPTTIEGWTLRNVVDGTATLEGPAGGIWKAARGDTVPGLGRVDSIVLWGGRWIVSTSRGLITTQ
jgi:hypothetical protein